VVLLEIEDMSTRPKKFEKRWHRHLPLVSFNIISSNAVIGKRFPSYSKSSSGVKVSYAVEQTAKTLTLLNRNQNVH